VKYEFEKREEAEEKKRVDEIERKMLIASKVKLSLPPLGFTDRECEENMAEKLKPCPRCGTTDTLTHETKWNTFNPPRKSSWKENVSCLCGFWAPIDAWDARAESPELKAIKRAIEMIVSKRVNSQHDMRYLGLFSAQNIIIDELAKEGVTL
jgi:hypothetical protein